MENPGWWGMRGVFSCDGEDCIFFSPFPWLSIKFGGVVVLETARKKKNVTGRDVTCGVAPQ